MFKGIIIFILTVFCVSNVYASTVYDYPASADSVAKNLPELNSTSCKFSQEKSFKNTTLKSGGNFQFIKDKGVIFETLYPVKSTTSYTSSQNKQINAIVTGIANKDYSFINKNFKMYYIKNGEIWTVALRPKENTPASKQLKDIVIHGKTNINQININTLNGTNTAIQFFCN